MKIILGKMEFEQMVDMWVYKNFVEKSVVSSNIEDSQVVIEVSDDGSAQEYLDKDPLGLAKPLVSFDLVSFDEDDK